MARARQVKSYKGVVQFSKTVSLFRQARGITQIELASRLTKATGVKWVQNRVSRLETGEGRLYIGDALAVASVLSIPDPFKNIDVHSWYEEDKGSD